MAVAERASQSSVNRTLPPYWKYAHLCGLFQNPNHPYEEGFRHPYSYNSELLPGTPPPGKNKLMRKSDLGSNPSCALGFVTGNLSRFPFFVCKVVRGTKAPIFAKDVVEVKLDGYEACCKPSP